MYNTSSFKHSWTVGIGSKLMPLTSEYRHMAFQWSRCGSIKPVTYYLLKSKLTFFNWTCISVWWGTGISVLVLPLIRYRTGSSTGFLKKKCTATQINQMPDSADLHFFLQMFIAVLRIHDILVWIQIRIWICGSMPLTNGSGSCFFRHWPSRCQQKTNLKVFLLITFWRYIYIIFTKQQESRFFLQFLLGDRRIWIRIRIRIHTSG